MSERRTLGQLNEQLHGDLGDHLTHIKKTWWVFPEWAMAAGCLLGLGSVYYFDGSAARLGSAVASLYCAAQVAYRLGVYYGFGRGFQAGHERVVDG